MPGLHQSTAELQKLAKEKILCVDFNFTNECLPWRTFGAAYRLGWAGTGAAAAARGARARAGGEHRTVMQSTAGSDRETAEVRGGRFPREIGMADAGGGGFLTWQAIVMPRGCCGANPPQQHPVAPQTLLHLQGDNSGLWRSHISADLAASGALGAGGDLFLLADEPLPSSAVFSEHSLLGCNFCASGNCCYFNN